MPTKKRVPRRRAPSKPRARLQADRSIDLPQALPESRVALYLEWSSSTPIEGPMTREKRIATLKAFDAWRRWAELDDGADPVEMRRIDQTISEISAAMHRVRLRAREQGAVLNQQKAAADLRNLIIRFALAYSSSLVPGPATSDDAADWVLDGTLKRARSLSETLAARLLAAKTQVGDAIRLLPDGRREVIYVLECVLSNRPIELAVSSRQKKPGNIEARRSAERRFDKWERSRQMTS